MAAAGVRLGGTLLIKPATPRTNMLPACHIALFNPIYIYQHIYYIKYIHQVDNCNIYKNQYKAGNYSHYAPCLPYCIVQSNIYLSTHMLYWIYLSIYIPTDKKCTINMPPMCYVSCPKQYSSLFHACNIYQFTLCTNKETNIKTPDQCGVNHNYQKHHKEPRRVLMNIVSGQQDIKLKGMKDLSHSYERMRTIKTGRVIGSPFSELYKKKLV